MEPQRLYEQFVRDTGLEGRALSWEELPQFVRSAWERVREAAREEVPAGTCASEGSTEGLMHDKEQPGALGK